jgi:uncharacterized protein YjbI with pentapeptide repeats
VNLYRPHDALNGPKLIQAHLSEVTLRLANLSEADLMKANFVEANLSSADLTEANLISQRGEPRHCLTGKY